LFVLGPPEPRICTATGLARQLCADALGATENNATTQTEANLIMHDSRGRVRVVEDHPPLRQPFRDWPSSVAMTVA
jgi:hypothetical protein